MYYTKFVFKEESCGKFKYGFKIDMLCKELEISYNNFLGGYTTKGIKLNRQQYKQLKHLLEIDNFEYLRKDPSVDYGSLTDMFTTVVWYFKCISDNGKPILEVDSGMDECFFTPKSLIDLVNYIAKIGMEPEVLGKMKLL